MTDLDRALAREARADEQVAYELLHGTDPEALVLARIELADAVRATATATAREENR